MSAPPVKYLRYFDFTTFATLNPEKPLPGASVDVEFNRLKSTTDQTIDRLNLIQRDDGLLRDGAITTNSLADGAVTTPKLADLAVTTPKLADGAVTGPKIAPGSLIGSNLAPGSITSLQLADGGVATVDLADGAVTNPKLGPLAVDNGKLALLSVATGNLIDLLVTTPKLADLAVTTAKLALLAVATGNVQDAAITAQKIAPGAITGSQIPDGSVAGAKLVPGSIGTVQLADGGVTLAKMAPNSVDSSKIVDGSIDPADLSVATIGLITAAGNPRGAWVTGTAYATKDAVTNGSGVYVCVTAHVAGATFAADLAAGKWYQTGQVFDQNLNKADTAQFAKVLLGGITAGFPMLKPNGPVMAVRLADDSGDAALTAGPVTPGVNNLFPLGTAALRWSKLWAQDGDFSGNVNVAGAIQVTNLAAPNKIINGDFRINQRYGLGVPLVQPNNQQYFADNWQLTTSAATGGKLTATCFTNPSLMPGGAPATYFEYKCTTAVPGPANGDYWGLNYNFEGSDCIDLLWGYANGQPVVLSFWARSTAPGTYTGAIRAANSSKSYVFSYTTAAAGNWQKFSIAIPPDIAGAGWPTLGNNVFFTISFCVGSGAGNLHPLGGWQAGDSVAGVGQTNNLLAAVNNFWHITGVKLETGVVQTPFVSDPVQVALAKSQRYYFKEPAAMYHNALLDGGLADYLTAYVLLPVTMRASPSVKLLSFGTMYYWGPASNGILPAGGTIYNSMGPTGGRCGLAGISNPAGAASTNASGEWSSQFDFDAGL
jgi:hypothetical protein